MIEGGVRFDRPPLAIVMVIVTAAAAALAAIVAIGFEFAALGFAIAALFAGGAAVLVSLLAVAFGIVLSIVPARAALLWARREIAALAWTRAGGVLLVVASAALIPTGPLWWVVGIAVFGTLLVAITFFPAAREALGADGP